MLKTQNESFFALSKYYQAMLGVDSSTGDNWKIGERKGS